MKKSRTILYILSVIVISLAALYFYFVYSPEPQRPVLSAVTQDAMIQLNGLNRTYTFYIPEKLTDHGAPLVFVLHGSLQTVADIRKFTGYEFERLAEDKKFIVVYPQGYEKNWNDCRKSATYPAKTQNIDDKGFIQALTKKFVKQYGADAKKIFIVGFSNGGHFGFRLALEQPEEFAGITAISANLPTADNSDCVESGKSVSILIMNGTEDPINPYDGGRVTLFGFGNRGTVRSTLNSSKYFAELAGYNDESSQTETLLSKDKPKQALVNIQQWSDSDRPNIALYEIIKGGHLIPQSIFRAPRILGLTISEFNGPEEIWDFFSNQQPKR